MGNKVVKMELGHNMNINHRKEKHFSYQVSALQVPNGELNGMREIVALRIYGTREVSYACLWVLGDGSNFGNGSGRAGGWGYHRDSASAQEAITSAGIELEKDIDGVGSGAMEEAVLAIARHVTSEPVCLHTAHG